MKINIQWSLQFRPSPFYNSLHFKTSDTIISVFNKISLHFKTTFNLTCLRPFHFPGRMGGLKMQGPLYAVSLSDAPLSRAGSMSCCGWTVQSCDWLDSSDSLEVSTGLSLVGKPKLLLLGLVLDIPPWIGMWSRIGGDWALTLSNSLQKKKKKNITI